ncbi:MAG TPA: sugar transferase [Chthonomonadaceae bacterium]|nr:sugar transferase [Chthonomonadaceae bacterium]
MAWVPGTYRHPLILALGCLLGLLVMLAVVLERDSQEPLHRDAGKTEGQVYDRANAPAIRALIVGSGPIGRTLAESLESRGKYQVVGFVDDHLEPGDAVEGWPVLGKREQTLALIREHAIEEVLLAPAPAWQHSLAEELAASYPQVQVRIVPSSYEAMMRMTTVESLGDIAVVRLISEADRVTMAIKRSVDLIVALLGLLLLAPVILVVAILIKLTSPGPAIFAQERVGRYGRTFTVYKFRTMVADAEAQTGPVLSDGKQDVRLTPLGSRLRAFRIDEIPQFWNVLRGEMSLVGPRPERPVFVEQFLQEAPIYARRHQVRPGITGLAQICGGYHTDWRDKLRFDLIYVSHQSLWLDLSIMLRTIRVCCFPDH